MFLLFLFLLISHFTREALPRLDNYRNILSIQAGNRPTLEELHNATIMNKVILGLYLFLEYFFVATEKSKKLFFFSVADKVLIFE